MSSGRKVTSIIFLYATLLPLQAADPVEYYNIYRNTPRVALVKPEGSIRPLQESDAQQQTLSRLADDFRLEGSSFFRPAASTVSRVPVQGLIKRLYPDLKRVTRIRLSFKKRGQNFVSLTFTNEIEVPLWAESFEFWSLEHGQHHRFRIEYRDASGKHFFIDFGKTSHKGWYRFAKTIPQRIAKGEPFSRRYRKLWIVRLLILDDHAGRSRSALYHLANLGVSRVRRTLSNRLEHWRYRRMVDFSALVLPGLKRRVTGFKRLSLTTAQSPQRLSNRLGSDYLQVRGTASQTGIQRIRIRLPANLRTRICRSILLSVLGNAGKETIFVLVRSLDRKYYLIRLGVINFSGWRKLQVTVPRWITQKTHRLKEKRGLSLQELLILPHSERTVADVDLGLDTLAVVEDIGEELFLGIELTDLW